MCSESRSKQCSLDNTAGTRLILIPISFLFPLHKAFTASSGVAVETRDISLAGRVLANFPDSLTPEQQVDDALSELGVSNEKKTSKMCVFLER